MQRIVKNSLLLTLLLSVSAYASYPTVDEPFTYPQYDMGFYMGGQVGWGKIQLDNGHRQDFITNNTVYLKPNQGRGGVGRINIGFNANSYFGLEMGAGAWRQAHFNQTVTNSSGVLLDSARTSISAHDLDFLAKVTFPFNNGLGIFTKFGAARLVSNTRLSGSLAPLVPSVYQYRDSKDHALRPEVAAGINYRFNPNWVIDVDYDHIFGQKNNSLNNNYLPGTHSVTFGVQYNFVNWL